MNYSTNTYKSNSSNEGNRGNKTQEKKSMHNTTADPLLT